jgi:hypothetical protein
MLFHHRSAAYPPVLDRLSTGFCTSDNMQFPEKIRDFPASFTLTFRTEYQQ